jgi:Rha family phage regulatory protein
VNALTITNEAMPIDEFVGMHEGHLVTDSRRVAKHFGKRHDNVLRAYDSLDCSGNFRALNFEEGVELRELANGTPIRSRIVRMTKDGFMFLVMGFTGKEAARIKETYINAFNAMAEQVRSQSLTLWHQRQLLEMRDQNSFVRAQFGSRLMLERKGVKPVIASERAQLEALMQPGLIGGDA